MPEKTKIKWFVDTVLNSYSQIFFSENKLFAFSLLLVSFIDYRAGLFGLISVLVANITAYILGFDRLSLTKGLYGYNALLVGLGTGIIFKPSPTLGLVVVFVALLTLFITIALQGILYRYALPFLSLPFLFGIWAILLATKDFSNLGLSESGIFTYNELYALGGSKLVALYDWMQNFPLFEPVKIYLLSLGAIFFQSNLLAGLIIAIGLLYHSRIAFSLSVLGFAIAYLFYHLIGADFSSLAYTFIGFNYILTSIAIGGYFVIASVRSYLWVIILLPVTVIITAGLMQLFSIWELPIYALPFNIMVLLFIYVLKLRVVRNGKLIDSFVSQATPEQSLYLHHIATEELKNKNYFPINLPVKGTWFINQGHNGKYTHQDKWQHAWDFVIIDEEHRQFSGNGDLLIDYYAWDKPVFSPAAGVVAEIKDGIPDNIIGDINTAQNWGNTVVIKHTETLYSQLSHLKEGSILVQKGDFVRKGQRIATVGNSGHSPYPHLHFQLQETPYIGSVTIDYPIHNYIIDSMHNPRLISFGNPKEGQIVSPATIDDILNNALHFIPGKKLNVTWGNQQNSTWEVYKDIWNQTYIVDTKNKATLYFYENESGLFLTNYYGNKQATLFTFFSALYNINKSFYKHTLIKSSIRPDLYFEKYLTVIQDFMSPFYIFLQSKFQLQYLDKDDEYLPDTIYLQSEVRKLLFGKEKDKTVYQINIHKSGEIVIQVPGTNQQISIQPYTKNMKH